MGDSGGNGELGKVEVDQVRRDHSGMVCEGDVDGWGSRAFVVVWGMDGQEVAGGA